MLCLPCCYWFHLAFLFISTIICVVLIEKYFVVFYFIFGFFNTCIYLLGLLWWLSGEKSACQCRRHGFSPWVGKIPWRRKGPPTPVFLPGKSHGQRSLAGYSPPGNKESGVQRHLVTENNKQPLFINVFVKEF